LALFRQICDAVKCYLKDGRAEEAQRILREAYSAAVAEHGPDDMTSQALEERLTEANQALGISDPPAATAEQFSSD
jgi:hypothetical protein